MRGTRALAGRWTRRAWALAGLGLLWGCCIWGTDEPYLAGGPLEPLAWVEAVPPADGTPVGRWDALGARFSDRVRPDSVVAGHVRLLVDAQEVLSATRVDLLDCTVRLAARDGLPAGASVTVEIEGVEGFGTGPLEAPVSLSYTTDDATASPAPPDPPSFDEVYVRVIEPRCAFCHGAYESPGGLDLSSRDTAFDSLRYGQSEAAGGRRYVVPGRHAESYLMWKVLGLPGVDGDPMPRAGDWPADRGCGTADPDLRLLADWIDGL